MANHREINQQSNKVEHSTIFVIIVTTEVTSDYRGYQGTYRNHVNTFGLVRQLRVKDTVSGTTLCLVDRIRNNYQVLNGANLEYGIASNTR